MASFRRCTSILYKKYLIFLACITFSLGPFKSYPWWCAFAISTCPWCWPKRDVLLVSISRKSSEWKGWCHICFIRFPCNNMYLQPFSLVVDFSFVVLSFTSLFLYFHSLGQTGESMDQFFLGKLMYNYIAKSWCIQRPDFESTTSWSSMDHNSLFLGSPSYLVQRRNDTLWTNRDPCWCLTKIHGANLN